MAKNISYNGTIDLISGIRPKNNGTFPLVDAHDVQTREDGTRLDEELVDLQDLGASKVDKVDGKELSTNDYTDAEKDKLSGISHNAEVNQNTFSNIAIGNSTIFADAKSDTLTFEAGSNVVLTPDIDNDKVTIDVEAISNDLIDIICAD